MSQTEKPKAKIIVPPKKIIKKKNGRPRIKLTSEQKKLAVEYVSTSGLWKVRLAKFLKISFPTFESILKKDRSFFNDLEAADALFVQRTIKGAKPEFILRTKYKEEFPDNSFSDSGTGGSEELDAVILRIRKILPASGQ